MVCPDLLSLTITITPHHRTPSVRLYGSGISKSSTPACAEMPKLIVNVYPPDRVIIPLGLPSSSEGRGAGWRIEIHEENHDDSGLRYVKEEPALIYTFSQIHWNRSRSTTIPP